MNWAPPRSFASLESGNVESISTGTVCANWISLTLSPPPPPPKPTRAPPCGSMMHPHFHQSRLFIALPFLREAFESIRLLDWALKGLSWGSSSTATWTRHARSICLSPGCLHAWSQPKVSFWIRCLGECWPPWLSKFKGEPKLTGPGPKPQAA